jgi:hypothetical protein
MKEELLSAGISVGIKEKDDPVSEGLDLMVGISTESKLRHYHLFR